MKVLKGVLEEELASSLKMKKEYERVLADLPKGALVEKRIRGHDYYYLIKREGKKVRFEYKGKMKESEIKKYEEAKKKRARYRKLLSEVNKQIAFLRKALRGKEIRSM